MLEHALAWAARGFRVFPVDANTRGGEGHYPLGAGWTEYATNDPVVIERFWTIWPDANVACLATGFVIADVDVEKGKAGLASMHALGLDDFETLVVRTTTGGYHLYYQGLEDRLIGSHPIADGIDTRSHHAYVIAPGSEIDGKPYTLEVDLPPAPVPEHIAALLHEPRMAPQRPNGNGHHVYSDTPTAVRYAEAFLAERAVAIEGQNGDDWTFKTICQLRDLNLSPEMAFEVLWPWNLRCLPPWSPQELTVKIRNAYTYATGFVGQADPQTHFAKTHVEPPPAVAYPVKRFGHRPAIYRTTARPWVYPNLLMRDLVTTLIGSGAVGKSILVLMIAAHLACGEDVLGSQCRLEDGASSIVYNGEDDAAEMSRRLEAICKAYSLDQDRVNERVMTLTEEDFPDRLFSLADRDRSGTLMVNVDAINHLLSIAEGNNVAMIGLGPLVELHGADENDNAQMRYVMKSARTLARYTHAAVLLDHHTSQTAQLNRQVAGNMYAARGATSIINSSRVALTMSRATEEEGVGIGIAAGTHRDYLRVDDAKQQFSRLSDKARWFKWEQVQVGDGELVGVPVGFDAELSADGVAKQTAEWLDVGLRQAGVASWTIAEAENYLREMNEPWEGLKETLRQPQDSQRNGSRVQAIREGKRWIIKIV